MAGRFFCLNNMPRKLSLQKERNFNLEDWTEETVIKELRMSKSKIKYICDLIKDSMQLVGYRLIDLSLEQKLLLLKNSWIEKLPKLQQRFY